MTSAFVIVMAATLATISCQGAGRERRANVYNVAAAAAAGSNTGQRVRRGSAYSGGVSSSSSTYAGEGAGGVAYPDYGYGQGGAGGGGHYQAPGTWNYDGPGPGLDFSSMMEAYHRALMEFHEAAQRASYGASGHNAIGMGGVGASASGSLGSSGGYGSAQVYPEAENGLSLRFGDSVPVGPPVNSVGGSFQPPAPGGSYGVFTSSSSGQSTMDGQTKSWKTASVGVNDNGRVTTYTAHNP